MTAKRVRACVLLFAIVAGLFACAPGAVRPVVVGTSWFSPDPSAPLDLDGARYTLASRTRDVLLDAAGGADGGAEDITGQVAIRKDFEVPADLSLAEVQAASVEINLYEAVGNQAPLRLTVNDHEQIVGPGLAEQGHYRWKSFAVDLAALRTGINRTTLSVATPTDTAAWAVLTKRSTYPNRSARSTDGGRSWDANRLGTYGTENGEYSIRLRLTAPARVTLISSITEFAAGGQWIQAQAGALKPGGGLASHAVRFGPLPIPDADWTEWQKVERDGVSRVRATDRYAQSSIRLQAGGVGELPTFTPLEPTSVRAGDAALERVNHWLPFGSRFRYQELDDPALSALRTREGLEAIAATDDEDLQVWRLREWARQQFPDGDPNPYPPLNALTILDWIRSGKTQGFCGQHAYVFGQALLSLGYQIRYVELGMNRPGPNGDEYFPAVHFSVEYWSPTHKKWIYADPNKNLHMTLNGKPLSALEIHDLYMTYFDAARRRDPNTLGSESGHPPAQQAETVTRSVPGIGSVRVYRWDLAGAGALEVVQGPHEGGEWLLAHFYYVRVRLRNDELMHPSQDVADLPQISPSNEDGFNPNGMLEFEDPRCVPVKVPIALYTTAEREVFDWPLVGDELDSR